MIFKNLKFGKQTIATIYAKESRNLLMQLKQAAHSITTNILEGHARKGTDILKKLNAIKLKKCATT